MTTRSFKPPGFSRLCRLILLAALFVAAVMRVAAHQGAPPLSLERQVLPTAAVQQIVLPPTDVPKELAADGKNGAGLPLRFATPQKVELTPATSGTWEQLADGRLWRLRIASTNATDLNMGFTTFWLPEGARLYLIGDQEGYYQGPYTAADNKPHGQLWTPVVPGETATIELFVPAGAQAEPRLVLAQVGTGYRDLFHRRKDLGMPKAGNCEIDVACPESAPWANEIRSVARIQIAGTELCSGTLIMNAASDFRAFFLTANHCGISARNASSVVAYWNYQSSTCGQHGDNPSMGQNQTGATFRAAKYDVDFCLLELDRVPDASYNVYYAGWDRSGTAPAGAVGIHHPNGDGKCVSFSSTSLTTVNSCIGTGGSSTHWHVLWSAGVTEPGSSGSGIWSSTSHQLVGTLSGGSSVCGGSDLSDCYGKFSVAWGSGNSSATRLRDWLDPQDTGVTSVSGSDPVQITAIATAGSSLVSESCTPGNQVIDPAERVTVNFGLRNAGSLKATNLVATMLETGGVTQPSGSQTYGALTTGGSGVSRSFAFTAGGVCGGTITPTLQLQDGTRDLGTVIFSLTLGTPTLLLSQSFDGVTAPALPAGWTTSASRPWVTSTAQRDTLPNSAFAPDVAAISDYQLTSPALALGPANGQLSFRHYYKTETNFDGGVLEIAINGGAFMDILTAGGSFVSGGYTLALSGSYGSPLAGRWAWSGYSSGFITTTVNLPSAAAGQSIQLRWRQGNDSSVSATGWYIDTISLSEFTYTCCTLNPNDYLPPNLVITSHSDLQPVATNAVTLTGTASDAGRGDNGIAAVRVNGLRATNDTATGSPAANWSYKATLQAGTNALTVVATDNASNSATNVLRLISDTVRPALTVTAPTSGQRWSNAVFTVKSTATDNARLAGVWCQANGVWASATTANGTNWTLDMTLTPGTNTLKACAVDLAGNFSPTNNLTFTYVVSDRLVVNIIGNGTISPNYNGAMLELGKRVTMRATPGSGFGFTGWTGSLVTTNRTLTFPMASNLAFTANFADLQKPAIAITSPAAGQRWSNAVFTIKGTAKDNGPLAGVWCLSGGAWAVATSTNGWTNWTAAIPLLPGTNTVKAYATDAAGNRSPTNSVSLIYVLRDRLTLLSTGPGTFSPNYSNAFLEIGRNYTITAAPGTGYVFSNWIGSVLGNTVLSSNAARLSFPMRSNLVLQANIIPNPFLPAKGTYYGLFSDTNGVLHESSGLFKLTLTDRGAYSGSLQVGGKTYSLTGQFDLAGAARTTNSLTLTMALDLAGGGDRVTGSITTTQWVAGLLANRAVFDTRTNPATRYAGKYTLNIPGSANGDGTSPAGDGYGTLTVATNGTVTLSGSLADSTNFTQSVPLSRQGDYPLYAQLYGGKGSVWSWLRFDTNQPPADVHGVLSWIRTAQPTARFYPLGFTNHDIMAAGSRYVAPSTRTNPVIPMTEGVVVLEGGNLAAPLTNLVMLTATNRVLDLSVSNKLSLTLTLSSGLFNGSLTPAGTTRALQFKGALFQSEDAGAGFFLGTNQSGRVYFGP